jgi:prepilin-type N-terminal cleavage/methylation domain-containing protein
MLPASCVVRKTQYAKRNTQNAFTPLQRKLDSRIKFSFVTGFTFIEMIIVLAMLSVVGLAIVTTLGNGIKIWQQLNLAVAKEDINIFFERIARELRNTYEFSTISFYGQMHEVSFPAFVVTLGSSLPQETGIGRIVYSYDKTTGELTREKRNYSQIYKGKSGSRQRLLNDIGSLNFSYYFYDQKQKEYMWLEEWQQAGLPLAVRIELEFNNGYQSERIIRTIGIPIAQSQS